MNRNNKYICVNFITTFFLQRLYKTPVQIQCYKIFFLLVQIACDGDEADILEFLQV